VDDADPQELPLREALIQWCDPLLVQRIRLVEEIVPVADTQTSGRPRLSDSAGNPKAWRLEKYAGVLLHDGEIRPRGVFFETWKRLEADFRRRVERGEIHLAGVSTWPMRETERRPIPNLWAADFSFNFGASRINVVQFQYATHSYVAVVASLRTHVVRPRTQTVSSPTATTSMPMEVESPTAVAWDKEDNVSSVVAPPPTRRKDRGRANYGPIIEAALLETWDEVARRYPAPAKPIWAEVARMLHGRLAKRHARNPQAIVPHVETFRTSLPDIYAKVLSGKAELNKSAQ
jgi:hypothetical protein